VADHNIHIISFDIPFPANYGGVIDIYYKLKALHERGVKVHLHCFEYNREPAPQMELLCEEVHYYPRKTGLIPNLSLLPYIVVSRKSEKMIKTLLKDDYPILFEGMHSCYHLSDPRLKGRVKVYRESNIEHQYYHHLARAESSISRKLYYSTEAVRLKWFEKKLRHADLMLVVSKMDEQHLKDRFPDKKVQFLPSFHREEKVSILPGKGSYALYHGKLSIVENQQAAAYLVQQVWDDSMPELIIAGLNPSTHMKRMVEKRPNIRLMTDLPEKEMDELIRHAHVNILVTFQPTGLKLKLLHALFSGRFCIVNPLMLTGTNLDHLCLVGNDPDTLRQYVHETFHNEFLPEMIETRAEFLNSSYGNKKNCQLLLEYVNL